MRAFRWLLITGAVVVGLVIVAIAIGSIWLNSFIHSPAFKTEVETRASQSVGGPVQINAIDFDIFHGVKLGGLVTQIDPAHAGGQGALKVQVASVNCTYSLMELLSRRLRLTGITLDQPQIILTKEATPAVPAQLRAGGPDSGSTAGPGTVMPFQFVLDRARINNGVLSIHDALGATMVTLKGISASANTAGYYTGTDVTGTVRIDELSASNMVLKNFNSPFTYHANYLAAKSFDATAFGGNIAGDYLLDGSGLSVLNVNVKGLDVAQVTAATSSGSSAKLSGSLDLQSKWRGAETGDLNGEGDAQLTNGKLQGVKILEDVGSILRIKELTDPTITKAQTHFVVRNRETAFNGLQLESPLFLITGNGVIGFNGALNADLVLVLGREVMGKIPKELAASFVQKQDGTGSISFHVAGTTSNPSTNLPERLLLQNTQIKNVLDKALNKFFH